MITTSQRRRAKRAVETYHGATDRYTETVERLVRKRCALRGVKYLDPNKADWNDPEQYKALCSMSEIRYGLQSMVHQDKYVNKCMERAGFTYLNRGASRSAYTHADGWVYKIVRSKNNGDNLNEIRVARAYHQNKHKSPGLFYIPFMALAYGVIIAEKMSPSTEENHPGGSNWSLGDFDRFLRDIGYRSGDIHGENYWWDGSRWVCVDLGHFRPVPR